MKSAELSPASADASATTTPEELCAAIRLIRTPSIGPRTFYQLIKLHSTAMRALEAVPMMAQRGGKKAFELAPAHTAETELSALAKLGAKPLLWRDAAYPALLRQLGDAPPLLCYLGNTQLLSQPAIAMVGARNASLNGMRFTETLAKALAAAGHIVISGLARGVDSAAHKGAGAEHTIAVLGGGIDHIYPRENTALYHSIAEQGLLLSECAPGTIPHAEHFPRRNRIVSGLSLGTVVMEAAARSGSLITARFALEQGREVMAVPGSPLDPRAEGPNKLIREGATLVTSAEDVLEAVRHFTLRTSPEHFALEETAEHYTPDEQTVEDIRTRLLGMLSASSTPVDDLITACDGNARAVLSALLELELAGRILRYPGNNVALVT